MYQRKNFVVKFNLPERFSEYICTSHQVWLTARQNSFSSCLQKDHYTSSVYHVIYRLRKKLLYKSSPLTMPGKISLLQLFHLYISSHQLQIRYSFLFWIFLRKETNLFQGDTTTSFQFDFPLKFQMAYANFLTAPFWFNFVKSYFNQRDIATKGFAFCQDCFSKELFL